MNKLQKSISNKIKQILKENNLVGSEYINKKTKIKITDLKTGKSWERLPNSILKNGIIRPENIHNFKANNAKHIKNKKKKSEEEIYNDVKKFGKNVEYISGYQSRSKNAKFRCLICKIENLKLNLVLF